MIPLFYHVYLYSKIKKDHRHICRQSETSVRMFLVIYLLSASSIALALAKNPEMS